MDETTLVTLARVAERAERYDEMADFMKQRVSGRKSMEAGPKFPSQRQERDMFSAAFKNSLTERRHAVRVAAGVEQMELAEGREAYASLAGGYRSKMEADLAAELQEICSNALALRLELGLVVLVELVLVVLVAFHIDQRSPCVRCGCIVQLMVPPSHLSTGKGGSDSQKEGADYRLGYV
eukprot:Skav228607  [mRNA]  locus=scaffold4464:138611:141809:- [translate_table: standard]